MLFRLRRNSFFRIYGNIAYIVNRLFGIDRIVDASGGVFLQALSKKEQSIDEICKTIIKSFKDVDIDILKHDAMEFYLMLAEDGFLLSGETVAELESKDIIFSYSRPVEKPNVSKTSLSQYEVPSTQKFLLEYCKNDPCLIQVQIEITNKCNERCIHCYIPHNDKTTDIDDTVYYNILTQCHELGVLNITLSGGEPLLHPHFPNFLRKTQDYDFLVTVLTNLTILNDKIISAFKQAPLDSVQVTLFSLDSAIHDSITALPGSFEKTYNNILRLIEEDIPLEISCPIMKQNKDSFWSVVQWGKEKGIYVLVEPNLIARYDRTTDNLDNCLSLEEIKQILSDYINTDYDYQQMMLSREFDNLNLIDSESNVCSVCVTGLSVNPVGNVYPCTAWAYNLGSINNMSLRKIWETSSKTLYLRNIRMKDFPECMNCPDIKFCNLCMAQNANENPNGNLFLINEHRCQIAKFNHKIVKDWKAIHSQN